MNRSTRESFEVRNSLAPQKEPMPSKRYKKALELVDKKKSYPLKSAVEVLTKFPKAKFNETVDLAFRLGVDPKQSDQMVRGTVPLPHGSGKTVRVLVFAKAGPAADAAKAAGEDQRSEEHTSELQSPCNLVCRLLLEKKNQPTVRSPL